MSAPTTLRRSTCFFLSSSARYSRFSCRVPLASPTCTTFMQNAPKMLENRSRPAESGWPRLTSRARLLKMYAAERERVPLPSIASPSMIGMPERRVIPRRLANRICSWAERRNQNGLLPLVIAHAQYLFEARDSIGRLGEAVYQDRHHPLLNRERAEFARRGFTQYCLAKWRSNLDNLVNAHATLVTRESACLAPRPFIEGARSEEHTSELQSQFHLVCRL